MTDYPDISPVVALAHIHDACFGGLRRVQRSATKARRQSDKPDMVALLRFTAACPLQHMHAHRMCHEQL